MAVSAKYYGLFFKSLCNKELNLTSDSLKLSLHTSSYTPNQDTHQYRSSLTNEVTGTGYTAGGATVGSIVVAYNTVTNVLSIDGADVTWTASSITARYAVLYDSTPSTDATRPLIGYVDFGADVTSTSANLAVVWDVAGIAAVTVS